MNGNEQRRCVEPPASRSPSRRSSWIHPRRTKSASRSPAPHSATLTSPSGVPRVVESVGEHVEGFAKGDAVVPTFLGQCDQCSTCASEQNNLCTAVPFVIGPGMRRDGTTRFRDAQGVPLHDLLAVSSFSEYTVVDMNQVVRLDPAVPPKLACLLSCGAGTGVGAAWRMAKVEPGSSVAIFGLGSVGLAVAQGAKMCGASKIIGVDLNSDKEEVGKSFGVTDFINPSQLDKSSVIEVIGEMTGGGVDYSFECIGVSSVMTDAFRSTKTDAGKWQDDRPGTGEVLRAGLPAVLGAPVRQVRHGVALRGDQAQDRHPNPRREMHEQGAGVGRVDHARSRPAGHKQGIRPAPAGEEPEVSHMDGQVSDEEKETAAYRVCGLSEKLMNK
ncbi:alcohol dehydrogenase-like 7 isoform X2 [Phragmites australis]|uniref:alcohol dehydrogenase-like 7 isoform X2 n=1 Tax=Phragmites australis TaxID=29695 RepID=UPI002D7916E7|nr:alcohol dehydrogenase-like 7 isoform X2 [Phragmites australis]